MGKTDTIKERTIYIYAPSLEVKAKWEETAKQNKTSLSKWIIKNIEDTMQDSKEGIKTKDELLKENQSLKKEIAELSKEYKQTKIIRDNLEREIRKYRAEPFQQIIKDGDRKFDRELIDILRNTKGVNGKNRFIDNEEILSRLNVSPKETEYIQSIYNQLSIFEEYNLLESSTKGWRWKG